MSLITETYLEGLDAYNVTSDDISRVIEVIDELLESFSPRPWLGEDRRPLPVVHPGHVVNDGDGSGGALVSPVLGDLRDAGWDVPQTRGDGASPSIDRVYGDLGSVEEGLDLRLQI